MESEVFAYRLDTYDINRIVNLLPDKLFQVISPGETIAIKPNWVLPAHEKKKKEWIQVITHPDIISSVIIKSIKYLQNSGKIILVEGPELNADFTEILKHFPINYWHKLASEKGIAFEIIDLRDELYIQDGNVTTKKIALPGDPKGKVIVNLNGDLSEFYQHKKSQKGYYGAGPDIGEANKSHDGIVNLYSVSRSVIEADVFINIPKLKTHKKAGITASLKNLVGINTYRNYLPHYSIGTTNVGGDQFPGTGTKTKIESRIAYFIKRHFLNNTSISRIISPFITIAKIVFGDNDKTIRGGSWYGNDTLWRTILDLNKILFYAGTNGKMREFSKSDCKKYITVVDAIMSGEGDGPKRPDPYPLNYIFCGSNPVSVDAVCARFLGFDPLKIPSISKAFNIKKIPIVGFKFEEIKILIEGSEILIGNLPLEYLSCCKPHRGWINHIEFKKVEI
jgi:uncharacterized protein (DUF362 family)